MNLVGKKILVTGAGSGIGRAVAIGYARAGAAVACLSRGHENLVQTERLRASLDSDAAQVLADAGYRSEAVFEQLRDHPSELVVALGREGKEQVAIDSNKYPRTATMAAKLQTDQAKTAYRKRKWIAEPPNGWIKSVLGLRQFSMRGLHRVRAEFKLVCLALNLRRMCAMQGT